MNIQREARRIKLSESRTSWEDKSTSEVAAGKLEVMEKFFTPLPHSSGRISKGRKKEVSRWEGTRKQYYRESLSSSSSSSPWSSESNFRVHSQFPGYNSRAPHSRSCIDLSLGKGKGSEDKRDFVVRQDVSRMKKAGRDKTDSFSPGRTRAGSTKKSDLGDTKDGVTDNKSGVNNIKAFNNGSRRAKSMEALSQKETRKRQGKDKKRVTEDKQRFSRFLDEITIQVLSPSNLNSLGVKERQNPGNQDQWKNSSTDSSGSKGKRSQCDPAVEQQEGRIKGKGKMGPTTKARVGTDTSELRRRRNMSSTSPDSLSSAQQRGEREDKNVGSSAVGHQPRRPSRRPTQEKGGKSTEQMEREKKEEVVSGGLLKGKSQHNEKAQNRRKEKFSGTHISSQKQEANLQSSVASILRHLPAEMLESSKVLHQATDSGNQAEIIQDKKSSAISSQTGHVDINSSSLNTESHITPRLTAFTPWSPRRERSLPALHTLYTSTESECSLEDTTPACRLLPPRFPNLGESFSEDWKDDQNTEICNSRSEQKRTGPSKSSQTIPSLLPALRSPQRIHPSRASSSESSGDDPLLRWANSPTYEPPVDYYSAQKILDNLLGLKTSSDISVPKPEVAGGFASVDASKIDGHLIRRESTYSNSQKNVVQKTEAKHMSYAASKDTLLASDQCTKPDSLLCNVHSPMPSPMPSPAEGSSHRLHPAETKIPPLPAKSSSFPGILVSPSQVHNPAEVGFRPVGKTEGSFHHKSEYLLPPCCLSTSTEPFNQLSDPFVLKSPSGNEPAPGNWEARDRQQEGQRERKPRKERTVTFHTVNNEVQSKQSLAKVRSKFMSSRFEDQGHEDSTSMDSTLL
ncbi:uncharacterized protein [Hyperolius riggenbachi]|uniref:uncharacterized protein isoform X2 n=1 Tax=Hyperolius riggenbachi TaxID=752182 RepID=UPI0035A330E5